MGLHEPTRLRGVIRRMKTLITNQGKCVVEIGKDILVMTPDSEIHFAVDRQEAEKICKDWLAEHCPNKTFGVGEIEWRDYQHKQKESMTATAIRGGVAILFDIAEKLNR